MIEVQHNIVNHVPHAGAPIVKRATLDTLAERVATVDPGTFRVVDRSINALLEISAPSGGEEEIYCPENFCQKSKKRDPEFHGPRSAFIECYKPSSKETRLPTVWTPSKGSKRRSAMLNAGMHRQSCTVEGTAPKSNKQKVYGILKRLRSALSGATCCRDGGCQGLKLLTQKRSWRMKTLLQGRWGLIETWRSLGGSRN